MGRAGPRAIETDVLERGDIFFLYRPRVDEDESSLAQAGDQ
jgi:hypothetical protein